MDVEEFLRELRAEVKRLAERVDAPLPLALTKKRAAAELSISVRKLQGMIKAGAIATCEIGEVKMIPRSEVLRLTRPEIAAPELPRGGGRKKRLIYDVRSNAEALRKFGRKT